VLKAPAEKTRSVYSSVMPADGIGAADTNQDFGTSRWGSSRTKKRCPSVSCTTLAKMSEGRRMQLRASFPLSTTLADQRGSDLNTEWPAD
jgi:hypothetical protein